MTALWLVQLAFAACPSLDAALDGWEASPAVYGQQVQEALNCQTQPLTPLQAARAHALMARAADARGDNTLAAQHLMAAWEAHPFFKLPTVSDPTQLALMRLQAGAA